MVHSNQLPALAEENDVKFIRLAFCDVNGKLKNIAITTPNLCLALERGMAFDASYIEGFGSGELLLKPDPSTWSLLPWRPSHGRVAHMYCSVFTTGGSAFCGDSRAIYLKTVAAALEMGYDFEVELKNEFYLFEQDEWGKPTVIPQDSASYCDVAPLDKGENVRREICLTLEEMGIAPRSSHHEKGPGQNEIVLEKLSARLAGDCVITFRTVTGSVAANNGLYADFDPRPLKHARGSSLRVALYVYKQGKNIFEDYDPSRPSEATAFVAGLAARAPECMAFYAPLAHSYDYWDGKPRLRIPSHGEGRIEVRYCDSSANPYAALSLMLSCGLEGIRTGADLKGEGQLPQTLAAARLKAKTDFVRNCLGDLLYAQL